MKRLILFIVLFISIWGLDAQVVITQNDMPSAGDTIRLSNSIDLSGINFQETGNNYTWDFSSLVPLYQSVDTFVNVDETPFVYQLVFFLSANLAQPLAEFNLFPGFELTDVFNFYKKSSSDFRSVGLGFTINGIPLPNKYNEPDILYHFPMVAGNVDSSMSSYNIDIPLLGYAGGWIKRVNHVDGWGTLITPYGDFQTLRMKSQVTQFDSLYVDSLGIGFPIYRNYAEYKWLGNGFGLPLCKITVEGLLPTISYIDSVRTMFVGVEEKKPAANMNIYPNPVTDKLYINLDLPSQTDLEIRLLNAMGTLVSVLEKKPVVSGNYSPGFSLGEMALKPGLYFISIQTGINITNKKIVIH
ncbi:MAG: T9SS type A sorting domain-containing protein [Bacteroidales bacterium]